MACATSSRRPIRCAQESRSATIPAAALAAIGRVLERFAQDHATEPVAAVSAADEISEDDIPF